MEGPLILLGVCLVALLFGGAISGIVALARLSSSRRELASLTSRISELDHRIRELVQAGAPPAPVAKPIAGPVPHPAPPPEPAPAREAPILSASAPPMEPVRVTLPPTPPPLPVAAKVAHAAPPPRPPQPPTTAPAAGENTFEVMVGTKWLGWLGAVLMLIGVGFFLKWAYDKQLIPPEGRLAIGALGGVVALGLGEHFRRKNWLPLFQTLTGIGIAVFYLCIFFSFHIYNLTGQSVSFGLAFVVTMLAVVMAVAHDALPIAVLGVIGGFLSPVIFSAGGNHPYGLFSYVIVIDLVALGAAYFRRWRALDLLCFLGTVAMYQSWYATYYKPADQMVPALLFATIFYILFLAIPTLYSLSRRIPERVEGLTLVAVDSLFSLYAYYNVLYADYRYALGFVVIAQAVLVFGLCRVWMVRVSRDSRTAQSLLIIALALVTLAIPIQLRLYGIPIAWAAEGVVFTWLGFRFRESIVRIGGAAALALAAGGLVHRLPLHTLPFTPIFNLPFGSWTLVIAATVGAAYLFHTRGAKPLDAEEAARWQAPDGLLAILTFLLGFVLAAALLTMECAQFWTTQRMPNFRNYEFDSLAVLWSIIPMLTLWAIGAKRVTKALPLAYICFGIGGLVFLLGLTEYNHPSAALAFNVTFLSKLFLVGALWWAAWMIPKFELTEFERETVIMFEVAANVLLTLLLAFEFERWSRHTDLIGRRMGLALISAAWAVQAFALIWVGLMLRKKPLRVLGFLLFGLTCAKVLVYDTSNLEQIYRIVSFMATGALLLLATWIYHRYAAAMLAPTEPKDEPAKEDQP